MATTPTITGHTTATSNNNSATFTVNPATNRIGNPVAVGDWMVMIITAASGSAVYTPTITGWTQISAFGIVGTGTMSAGVWAKIRQVGETTYTFNQTIASNVTVTRLIWGAGAQDPSQWVVGAFANRGSNGTATTNVAPSITTTTSHELGLLISLERTTAAETDPQITCTNFTKSYTDLTNDQSLLVGIKDMVTAGATGSSTITYPNTHAQNGIAGIIGITAVPDVLSGLPLKVSNGASLVDARFKLADGAGGFVTPGGMKVVRPGYSSVAQMLAQPQFYVAHRGGSRDYPEMSLYAYGQSALRGYSALELSLARTSDGVWFGLHDSTLDRTSGVTGQTASTLTWAQVQTYTILGSVATNNPSQPNRPYMRWEELMALYYPSHVIFVDPKAAFAYRAELLNMMDAMPGTPTNHFVAKYYGVVNNWPQDASARGYKGWGYFYQADAANFATYQGRWDILGMDYGADQATWDAIKSYGKPVIGHIAPNAAAATTAISKGANGIMASGVISIVPPAIIP